MRQARKQKRRDKQTEEVKGKPDTGERADLSETDALLDEIDEALEGLDRDLARHFVQKGGQ